MCNGRDWFGGGGFRGGGERLKQPPPQTPFPFLFLFGLHLAIC